MPSVKFTEEDGDVTEEGTGLDFRLFGGLNF